MKSNLKTWWLPLKVRVFIMQLVGWIEFGIRMDSIQPIFLLTVHDCTNRYIHQSVFLILHSLLVLPHNTFLALKSQRNSPSKRCLRKLLYVTCFGRFYFLLTSLPICCADNASLDRNGRWLDRLLDSLLFLQFLLKVP